jgi:hypothetical protein
MRLAFNLAQLCYFSVMGKTELVLHPLNNSCQGGIRLISIRSAVLGTSDCPIRFQARCRNCPLHDHTNEGYATYISLLDARRNSFLQCFTRNRVSPLRQIRHPN